MGAAAYGFLGRLIRDKTVILKEDSWWILGNFSEVTKGRAANLEEEVILSWTFVKSVGEKGNGKLGGFTSLRRSIEVGLLDMHYQEVRNFGR
ncbi:unnamed protein product [Dovyalis caffra]|uniref:Uncharacterized protein n=1 Tax=Dovyalis caffra TaxID=77055 RepID=A0AAV1RNJ6_9ROSI|nr:unnamed protein product [Dovyalis caffra]